MRVLGLLPLVAVVLLSAIVASQNPQAVVVRWFAWESVEIPLGFVLVGAACGGCSLVVLVARLVRPALTGSAAELDRRIDQLE
ncbi:MAG: LapA family protein, partial [Cyanobacteria bacterium J06648_11]